MIFKVDGGLIPYDNAIPRLCRTPYPGNGHAHGCINYGKKAGCPPQSSVQKFFDFDKELYVIATEFAVGEFADRMRIAHPKWKEHNFPKPRKTSAEYVNNILELIRWNHPDWPKEYFAARNDDPWTSSREWYNPRLWQGTARKNHREEVASFVEEHPELFIDSSPEARGVNVTGLMHNLGIELNWQWPPVHKPSNTTYIISLAGHPKTSTVTS